MGRLIEGLIAILVVLLLFYFVGSWFRADPELVTYDTEYFSVLLPDGKIDYTTNTIDTDIIESWRIELPSGDFYSVQVINYYPTNVDFESLPSGLIDYFLESESSGDILERPVKYFENRYKYMDSLIYYTDKGGYQKTILIIADSNKARSYMFAIGTQEPGKNKTVIQDFFDSIVLR